MTVEQDEDQAQEKDALPEDHNVVWEIGRQTGRHEVWAQAIAMVKNEMANAFLNGGDAAARQFRELALTMVQEAYKHDEKAPGLT